MGICADNLLTPASTTPTSSPLTPAPEPSPTSAPTPSSAPSLTSAPSSASTLAASVTVSASSTSTAATSLMEPSPLALSTDPAASPASQQTARASDAPTADPLSFASPTSSIATSAVSTVAESAPEDGRSRRARSSVSYKEPSLRTKMRKPDGVSSEEALGLRPRGSMLEGVRRKSALPRSTAKIDFRADKEGERASTPLAPTKAVKDTSPKEGNKKAAAKRRSTATSTAGTAAV